MNEQVMKAERARWAAPLIVLCLGVLAYANSLTGPFIFDDRAAIEENPQIRSLVPFKIPAAGPTTIAGRPVLIFSFAANYAMAHLHVEVYHVTNLLIHLWCGLLVYGIVRRTLLLTNVWGNRFLKSATWLAAVVAAIWIVHPLNTQSVTYLAQRAESLASLFMLASIYCVIRAACGAWWWGVIAVVACVLGMGSKEIVAATPVLAVLYDRTFLAGTFARARRLRWKIYAGMVAGFGLILFSLHTGFRETMVGFHIGISPMDYARTELNVIAHYVALGLWPVNLCFDYYDWPIARAWGDVSVGGWAVLAGVVACLTAVKWKPWLGFLGVWYCAILAPTSSFLPIRQEAAAEQRMYLPLVAIVVLIVVGGWVIVNRWKVGRWVVGIAGVAVIVALAWLTVERNEQYGSAVEIWTDTVAKRPNNARAHGNLGQAWAQASLEFPVGSDEARAATQQAAQQFRVAMALEPGLVGPVIALGQSLVRLGDSSAAERLYTEQLPTHPDGRVKLLLERGSLQAQRGDLAEAKEDFLAVVAAEPGNVQGHYYLGVVCQEMGDFGDAERELEWVVRDSPKYRDAEERLRVVQNATLNSQTRRSEK